MRRSFKSMNTGKVTKQLLNFSNIWQIYFSTDSWLGWKPILLHLWDNGRNHSAFLLYCCLKLPTIGCIATNLVAHIFICRRHYGKFVVILALTLSWRSSLLYRGANQWTGFHMIRTTVIKKLCVCVCVCFWHSTNFLIAFGRIQ